MSKWLQDKQLRLVLAIGFLLRAIPMVVWMYWPCLRDECTYLRLANRIADLSKTFERVTSDSATSLKSITETAEDVIETSKDVIDDVAKRVEEVKQAVEQSKSAQNPENTDTAEAPEDAGDQP